MKPALPWCWLVVRVRAKRDLTEHSVPSCEMHVLLTLAARADPNEDGAACPGEVELSVSTGLSVRTVRTALRGLVDRGFVVASLARDHARLGQTIRANRTVVYTLQREAIEAWCSEDSNRQPLPVGNRQPLPDDPPPQPAIRDGSTGKRRGGQPATEGGVNRQNLQTPPYGRNHEGTKEGTREKKERFAPPPSDLDVAFQVADDQADHCQRPRASRGKSSSEAMLALVADARAAVAPTHPDAWPQALGARLREHYEREDEALARCRWALKLALQVEQPRPVVGELRHIHLGAVWLECTTRIGPFDLVQPTKTLLEAAQTEEERRAAREASRQCVDMVRALPPTSLYDVTRRTESPKASDAPSGEVGPCPPDMLERLGACKVKRVDDLLAETEGEADKRREALAALETKP